MTGRARLLVERAGPLVTVQDRGRIGHRRYGVAVSGPMDWTAHALALHLAGCAPDDPAFEAGPGGMAVRCDGAPVRIGLAGLHGRAEIGEPGAPRRIVPLPARVTLAPGATLDVQPGGGTWCALAALGLDCGPPILGSHATNARTGLGPPRPGRGDAYACASAEPGYPFACGEPLPDGGEWRGPAERAELPIRLLPAPQTHLFDEASRAALTSEPYAVTPKRDRQGGVLEGPALRAPGGHDIVSDALVEGAIQVPGDGQPLVLTADCAPTGGYPKIAVVIRADLPRLVQARAGDRVRFEWTDEPTARAALQALQQAVAHPRPRPRSPWLDGTLVRR